MLAAIAAARDAARGHEALLVSHQLPIWIGAVRVEGRRLWHDPRKRQCALASLTSFTYDGDDLVSVAYTEPAADLLPVPPPGAGKKFGAEPDDQTCPPSQPSPWLGAALLALTGCRGRLGRPARTGPGLRRRRRDGHRGRGRRPRTGAGASAAAPSTGEPYDAATTTAARSSWSTSGAPGARRAAEAPALEARARATPGRRRVRSSASTPATSAARGARLRAQPRHHLPEHRRRRRRRAARAPRHVCRRRRSRRRCVHRPGGPGGRPDPRPGAGPDLLRASWSTSSRRAPA